MIATCAHSAVMLLGQRLARFRQPPQVIVDSTATTIASNEPSAGTVRQHQALALASHFAFGAGNGIVFAILRRRVGPARTSIAIGVSYGLAVYTVSYAGVLPAVGILPPPPRDDRARQAALIGAHVAFGVRGHEKVLVCGHGKVPACGHVKSPLLAEVSTFGASWPETVVVLTTPLRPEDAFMKSARETHGHGCRLREVGTYRGRGRHLRDDAEDREAVVSGHSTRAQTGAGVSRRAR